MKILWPALIVIALIGITAQSLQTEPLAPWVEPIWNNNGSPQPITPGSPLPVTMPSPAPTSSSDGGINIHQNNNLPAVTAIATTGPITTAATTLVLSGSTTLYTYVPYLGVIATSTNTTDQINFITQATTSTACDTPESALDITLPQPIGFGGSSAGGALALWSGSGGVPTGVFGIIPASQDLVIPPNTPAINVCIVTTGTTIAVKGVAVYTTRAYGI